MLIDSYAGALYLESQSSDAQSILSDTQHYKRMVFHCLMNKISARRMAGAFQKALSVNISKETHEKIAKDIELMMSFFTGKFHKGEEAWFDYIPGRGTRITLNGQVKGTIPGDLFFQSMLSLWIGQNPINREFKNNMLGLTNAP